MLVNGLVKTTVESFSVDVVVVVPVVIVVVVVVGLRVATKFLNAPLIYSLR